MDRLKPIDHEARARLFLRRGAALIARKYKELTVRLYDETSAMIDASDFFSREAFNDDDFEASDYLENLSDMFDKVGAVQTDVRCILDGIFPTQPDAYPRRMEDALSDLTNLANDLGGRKTAATTKFDDNLPDNTTQWTYNSGFTFS